MRRPLGVLSIGALVVALSPGIVFSSSLPAWGYDLRPQVLLQVFGETTDWRASIAAAYGDALGESPLRDLAFRPEAHRATQFDLSNLIASAPTFAVGSDERRTSQAEQELARMAIVPLVQSETVFAAPSPPSSDAVDAPAEVSAAQPAFTVGAYQPVQAPANVSLQSGAVSFGPIVRPEANVASAMLSGGSTSVISAPATLRLGPVRVEGQLQGGSAQVQQPSLLDSAYGAGADFAVRAGARKVDVGVASSYEQLTRNDSTLNSSSLGAQWQLPGGDAPVVIPGDANMSRVSLAAGVAVPLVNGLTLNVNYDTARLLGSYGLPGLTNLDAVDNAYGGGLTFAIPHSSGTLSLSAYQYRYQDNILNTNSSSQTRENVNFTVKF